VFPHLLVHQDRELDDVGPVQEAHDLHPVPHQRLLQRRQRLAFDRHTGFEVAPSGAHHGHRDIRRAAGALDEW